MLHLHMESASGLFLPLADCLDAAAQLSHCCRSCTAQHFRGASDRHADEADLEAAPISAQFYRKSKTQSDQFKTRNSRRGEFIVEIVIG
jgi:hypothetical protein